MEITILGSGGWEGIPAPFCHCRVCEAAMTAGSKYRRMRPQFVVTTDRGSFAIEISPDIRYQSRDPRMAKVTDFLVSHWHPDHMYGLLDLHWWAEKRDIPMRIHCSSGTKAWLDKNFEHIRKTVVVHEPFVSFQLVGATVIPLRLCRDGKDDATTFGFMIEADDKRFVYLSDYFEVPEKTRELVRGADVLVLDGTYLFSDEFPKTDDYKPIREDVNHLKGKACVDLAFELKAKRTVFHSITHLSGLKHAEMVRMMPPRMDIAYDGMDLRL